MLDAGVTGASWIVRPDPAWVIGKHALINLHGVLRNGRTEIDPKSWRIPYQWQGCHYQDHDDEPFLLLINSGGGFVEGDVAELHAHLERGTRALITTTSASKFYKCPDGQTSEERVTIDVGPEALLEYMPDEAIPFASSRVARRTRINLDRSSSLFATDMLSAGRISHGLGESFAFSSLHSEFEIVIGGRRRLLDRLCVKDAEELKALRRLWGDYNHLATVFAYASDLPRDLEDEVDAAVAALDGVAAGVSRIGDLIVCRVLADQTWQCHDAIYRSWSVMRPHLAGKPARPIRKC